MKYSLNVCKACINECKGKDCNVNDINNCVYETASAFVGIPSTNALNTFDYADLRKNCSDCVAKYVAKMGPFTKMSACDKKIDPPPVFANVPNYLPELLEKHTSLDEAKYECINKCNQHAINVNECIKRCKVQADSVELYKDPITTTTPIQPDMNTKITYKGTGSFLSTLMGFVFILLILFSIGILIFVRK